MAEKRVKIPFPTPQGPLVDGSEVSVNESLDKWSEITLEDGTVLRIKPNVIAAIRIDGQYDQENNPMYAVKATHVVMIKSAPDHLRKGSTERKVH